MKRNRFTVSNTTHQSPDNLHFIAVSFLAVHLSEDLVYLWDDFCYVSRFALDADVASAWRRVDLDSYVMRRFKTLDSL